MKKLLFLFAIICYFLNSGNVAFSQSTEHADSIKVYAQIIGTNNNVLKIGTKLTIELDFGLSHHNLVYDGRDQLVDENGKKIKFNSLVDAMNYMSNLGWKLESTYTYIINRYPVVYWVISKYIKADEDVRNGIRQIRDGKDKNEENKFDPVYN